MNDVTSRGQVKSSILGHPCAINIHKNTVNMWFFNTLTNITIYDTI